MRDAAYVILHRATNNVLAEFDTRAEAEAALADWQDSERDEKFEVVEVPTAASVMTRDRRPEGWGADESKTPTPRPRPLSG